MSIQQKINERKCLKFKHIAGIDAKEESCKLYLETLDKSKWCINCVVNHEARQIQDLLHKYIKDAKRMYDQALVFNEIAVNILEQLCGCKECLL